VQIIMGDRLDPIINARVHHLAGRIRAAGVPDLTDLVPAYATLTVHYDPLRWRFDALARTLAALLDEDHSPEAPQGTEVVLPVCYGGPFGPDLEAIAAHAGLSPEAVIQRHSAAIYRIYFLGFTPGFAYLGGLDPALAMARRSTPRSMVAAGSVGIGGAQTGVYSQATPGGWQIIGRTPLALFDSVRSPPCLLAPGDSLRFRPIDAATFDALTQRP
jgi:KipI family sensor histidine kinase inhibitor